MTGAVDPELDGYWPSAWPAEDGGPTRRQTPRPGTGFSLTKPDHQATSRNAFGASMIVLRDPGEVYLQGSTIGGPTPRRGSSASTRSPSRPRCAPPICSAPPPTGPADRRRGDPRLRGDPLDRRSCPIGTDGPQRRFQQLSRPGGLACRSPGPGELRTSHRQMLQHVTLRGATCGLRPAADVNGSWFVSARDD